MPQAVSAASGRSSLPDWGGGAGGGAPESGNSGGRGSSAPGEGSSAASSAVGSRRPSSAALSQLMINRLAQRAPSELKLGLYSCCNPQGCPLGQPPGQVANLVPWAQIAARARAATEVVLVCVADGRAAAGGATRTTGSSEAAEEPLCRHLRERAPKRMGCSWHKAECDACAENLSHANFA